MWLSARCRARLHRFRSEKPWRLPQKLRCPPRPGSSEPACQSKECLLGKFLALVRLPASIRKDPSLWLVSRISTRPVLCVHLALSVICPLWGALRKKLKRGVLAHETLPGADRRRSLSRILCSSIASPSPEHAPRRRRQSRNRPRHAGPVGPLRLLAP